MEKNDCDNCIRNADNDPRGCTISEYAYMTMDADGKCRQYMPKQRRKHEQIRQDHGGLDHTVCDTGGRGAAAPADQREDNVRDER